MTSARKSGNSSRKSTPQWARLISPGRTWPLPPPSIATLLASWWGAENGGRTSIPSPGSSAPAREWIAVSSSDSSRVRSGRIPGIRSAMLVLPAPLGPDRSTWCPPAAATSTANRASAIPTRSRRSVSSRRPSPRQESRRLPDIGATGGASGTSSPLSSATTWARDRMPSTTMSGTIAASRASGSGTTTRRTPRAAAASTIGSTPGTERRPPSRVSSPMKAVASHGAAGTWPDAASTETAMARSKWVPRLVRSAGESRIVIRRVAGQSRPLLVIAIRQRSRDSLSDTSGRPTSVVPTWPGETSVCTSIRWPIAPFSETVRVVATGISPAPGRARPPRAPGAVAGWRPGRSAPRPPAARAPRASGRPAGGDARAWPG